MSSDQANIVTYCAVEEVRILVHDRDTFANAVEVGLAYLDAIDGDGTFIPVVHSDELTDGRLARAGRAHNRQRLAGGDAIGPSKTFSPTAHRQRRRP